MDPTILQAFGKLASSRKAIVVVLAIVIVGGMGFAHVVEGDKVLEFVKWLVMAWLGAQAYEDGKVKSAALNNPEK